MRARATPAGWCGRDKWTYPGALVVPASKVPVLRVKGWVTEGRLVFDTDVSMAILVGEGTVAFGSPKASGPPPEDNPCAPDRVDAGLYACP